MAKNWALVIGINGYNPVNFAPLNYAKQDAERVKDFFGNAGFEVCFFTDDSPPLTLPTGHSIPTQPTYGNLITFLQDRFESPFLSTGDNCWFFFAGHGERHQDRDYLMPMDANSRGAEVIAGLTVNYVQERLSRCGADNVIMVLDACRSRGSRDGLGIGRDSQKGVITLASCQPTQKAWEIEELGQGAFTYAFLEALQLSGESSCATVERLGRYLTQRVPALCQKYGKAPVQVPRISVDPIEKQHFILIPQYARQADIDLLKLDVHRHKQTNPALAEQICIRLNSLAMGTDLEVMELWAEISNRIRSQSVRVHETSQKPEVEDTSNRSINALTKTTKNALENVISNSLGDDTFRPLSLIPGAPVSIFISYAQHDRAYMASLMSHLQPLQRGGLIRSWHVGDIPAGEEVMPQIKQQLELADIILLLISNDFLNSNSCYEIEMTQAIEYHQAGEAEVIPVLLRSCFWDQVFIKGFQLSSLQILPQNGQPISLWDDEDEAFTDVAKGLLDRIKRLQQELEDTPPRSATASTTTVNDVLSADFLESAESTPETASSSETIDEEDVLESEKGIDYSNLRDFLRIGNWNAADQETQAIILRVFRKETEGHLTDDDFANFPSTDLLSIDRLWTKYSSGKFGLSVQKKILLECGNNLKDKLLDIDIARRFGERVGWLKIVWKRRKDLDFSDLAPQGHLPFIPAWGGNMQCFHTLMSRLQECETTFSYDTEDLLHSDKGVDYSKLRDFLKASYWKAADHETYLRMLEVVGRKEGDWIRDSELLNFPCADLLTMDRLWVKYSQGRFGFSVQKQIYVECGAKLDGNYSGKKIWRRFGDKVGWRVDGSWIDYHDVISNISVPLHVVPLGQLPARAGWWVRGGVVVGWRLWGLFSCIEACKV